MQYQLKHQYVIKGMDEHKKHTLISGIYTGPSSSNFFFLSLLVRSYMSITPGSANLEILIKKKKKKKKHTKKKKKHTKKKHKKKNNTKKKHKNFWLNFCLNKECPKLLCGLGICHRRRQTIPMWNSTGEKRILQGITVCLVSAVLSTM